MDKITREQYLMGLSLVRAFVNNDKETVDMIVDVSETNELLTGVASVSEGLMKYIQTLVPEETYGSLLEKLFDDAFSDGSAD